MKYNYSICHPDKDKIEYRTNAISSEEVLKIAKSYPWIEQLNFSDSLDQTKVCYSPSLDFKCIESGSSFCLTADLNNDKKLQFSLWYNRPKKVKILFGVLGEKTKMVVDDAWSFNFDESIKYLEYFLNGNYDLVEKLYEK